MIRRLQENDLEAVYEIYSWYVNNTVINFDWQPEEKSRFMQEQMEIAKQYPYYVSETDGRIIGYGYAHKAFGKISYQFDAELTIYFRQEPHHGEAGKMLDVICEDLKKQNIHWLIGCITKSNETSIAFHKKHGFVYQGELPEAGFKFGSFHSVVWYGKELQNEAWYLEKERRFIPIDSIHSMD